MTEQEWLACDDPAPMIDFSRGNMVSKDLRLDSDRVVQVPDYPESNVSDRKLRLFACACCRRIWHLLKDQEAALPFASLSSLLMGSLPRSN
jgi:hypothetical protein